MKFRKLPVEIEAVQYDGTNADEIQSFVGGACVSDQNRLAISTLEGRMRVSPGDWVIKGIHGEFYPCKPDIFVSTYEPVL